MIRLTLKTINVDAVAQLFAITTFTYYYTYILHT